MRAEALRLSCPQGNWQSAPDCGCCRKTRCPSPKLQGPGPFREMWAGENHTRAGVHPSCVHSFPLAAVFPGCPADLSRQPQSPSLAAPESDRPGLDLRPLRFLLAEPARVTSCPGVSAPLSLEQQHHQYQPHRARAQHGARHTANAVRVGCRCDRPIGARFCGPGLPRPMCFVIWRRHPCSGCSRMSCTASPSPGGRTRGLSPCCLPAGQEDRQVQAVQILAKVSGWKPWGVSSEDLGDSEHSPLGGLA